MHKLIVIARQWLAREEGASIVEYGILLALIALVCVAAISLIGSSLSSVFASLAASM
jgi:pilus assembly protein Flp/PilA